MPKKQSRKLSELENQNNELLKKSHTHLDTVGFRAIVTVLNKNENLFEQSAEKVELEIYRGITFHFEDKILKKFKALGLERMYKLEEYKMRLEKKNHGVDRELYIELLNTDKTIIIKPLSL